MAATVLARRAFIYIPRLTRNSVSNSTRNLSSNRLDPNFGIMFDIDGVIVRGKKVIPAALTAFKKLVDDQGHFRIPTIFVTNAGNSTRASKAELLSEHLGLHITENQVVMAHSPLRMFKDFHSKHVLVVGQGPVGDIATSIGFNNVTTIEDLRHAFPSLDAVDHKRRRAPACSFEEYFPRIESVVLFGEPVRWETSLQLIIDVLLSDGRPSKAPKFIPKPHLPVLACNMDLQWMAEAVMPRFGHGAFLLCLESLFKKITGNDLVYSALIGKPSEITYVHGEQLLQTEATRIGLHHPVKNVYCVGDNVCTDIFGANLYNRYLQNYRDSMVTSNVELAVGQQPNCNFERIVGSASDEVVIGAKKCFSILVETGVYSPDDETDEQVVLNHFPRDFLPVDKRLQEPNFIVRDVCNAVDLIFEQQNFT